jgi:hypothetical protein
MTKEACENVEGCKVGSGTEQGISGMYHWTEKLAANAEYDIAIAEKLGRKVGVPKTLKSRSEAVEPVKDTGRHLGR